MDSPIRMIIMGSAFTDLAIPIDSSTFITAFPEMVAGDMGKAQDMI